jgi:hypothetical protein
MYRNGPLAFTTGAAVEAKRLVKLSSGDVIHNTVTSTDEPVGATLFAAGSGERVAVAPLNKEGTLELTAGGAISQDADVYAAADGKVTALSGSAGDYKKIGKALQAASGDGSIIEVLPYDYHTITTVT